MRKLIVFGISLLMMIGSIIPNSSAQDFRVTPVQLKQTNILFNQLEYLEKQDSLNNQLITYYVDWTSKLEEKDSLRQSSIVELNKQISSMDNSINILKEDNAKLSKEKEIATYFAIGGGVTTICLILLLALL
jgi:hypothetical protein